MDLSASTEIASRSDFRIPTVLLSSVHRMSVRSDNQALIEDPGIRFCGKESADRHSKLERNSRERSRHRTRARARAPSQLARNRNSHIAAGLWPDVVGRAPNPARFRRRSVSTWSRPRLPEISLKRRRILLPREMVRVESENSFKVTSRSPSRHLLLLRSLRSFALFSLSRARARDLYTLST